ncbi:ribulose-phosphate 3-epimerase [Candidatus Pacearchaeota archaeon]|nr:ribulose-phosphate 3-epimerase [Candidatus Pacearchaeota archaeon]
MIKIIPTIFAMDKNNFEFRLNKIISISRYFQIDFMDGKFVKGKSIKISQVPNLKKFNKIFEAHLMTLNPEIKIKKLKRNGFKKIIFHYESSRNQERIINKIKKSGLKCFIALNPSTPTKKIFPFLKNIDGVLLMGVNPGKEKQNFIPAVYKKIKEIKKVSSRTIVQIDGGVNRTTAKKLRVAGADILNTGSFVAEAKNPKKALERLKKAFI